MDKYASVMNQFPEKIWQETDKHFHSDIALLKPQTYVAGFKLCSEDYQIVIAPTPPPDTYINNRLTSFSSGEIVIFNPGDTLLCNKSQTTKQYFSLLVKSEMMNRMAREMGLSELVRFDKLKNPFSSELMQALIYFEKEAKRPDCLKLMMDSMSIQIVALLLREFKSNLKKYPEYSPEGKTFIDTAIEFMQIFYGANITIEDICKEINISPFHFIRTFKRKMGISPHQYLLNIRIKKAEELLSIGRYNVSEVSMLCGFVNQSHFSSAFKKSTGSVPSKYNTSY